MHFKRNQFFHQRFQKKIILKSSKKKYMRCHMIKINTIVKKKAINNTAPSNVIKDSHADIKDSELPEKNSTKCAYI